jgi:GNAT superfamily N-acetyltransferase
LLELRPLSAAEVPLAHAVEVAGYPTEEAASLERFRDRQARFPEGMLGVLEGGDVVALLSAVRSVCEDLGDPAIKREGGHDAEGADLIILSVCTHPAQRGRGLAGLLLAAARIGARRLGLTRIRLLCKQPLISLYARHGYRYVGRSACGHGGAAWHEMELRLR